MQTQSRTWLRRWSLRFIRVGAIAYLGLCLVFSFLQTSLIFPGAATQGSPEAVVRPREGGELVRIPVNGSDQVVALFGGALTEQGEARPDAAKRPTLLFFYGNGNCTADMSDLVSRFRKLGVNVMVPDYLGYGMSSGSPSEAGVYATADACYQYLRTSNRVDPGKIVPMGWSLGATAAIHLASKNQTPGLITISAFTSMLDMARHVYPIIPARLILKHHFENERKLESIHCPILIIHGRRDGLIPFEMSQRLAKVAGGKVTQLPIDEGDHNDIFDIGGQTMNDAIERFVNGR
jgi:uncharacterized protein